MKQPESYWSYAAPPIPEVGDLPQATFKGGERAWGSLSPGMRREIWRDALHREALRKQLSPDVISRLRVATIGGSLGTLDEYLARFEREDAARPAIREDDERLKRADAAHMQGAVQIAARETL